MIIHRRRVEDIGKKCVDSVCVSVGHMIDNSEYTRVGRRRHDTDRTMARIKNARRVQIPCPSYPPTTIIPTATQFRNQSAQKSRTSRQNPARGCDFRPGLLQRVQIREMQPPLKDQERATRPTHHMHCTKPSSREPSFRPCSYAR